MSKTIYLTILALVIVILVTLPIVFIPISSSSRGVVRSVQENTQLTAVVTVKELLGHANIQTTMIYTNPNQKEVQKAYLNAIK
jgi:hypothetical protein